MKHRTRRCIICGIGDGEYYGMCKECYEETLEIYEKEEIKVDKDG